jgi:Chalcone isomerase-like
MNSGIRIKCAFALAWVVSALALAPASLAADVAGVKLADTERVANQELKLNGAGIRYRAIFKVYVAALYLGDKKATTPEVIAVPGVKRMTLVMLRDLSSNDLAQAFMTGIQKNSEKAERGKVVNSLLKFGELFSTVPEVKKGDIIYGDWIPGTGAVFQYNGKKLGATINDPLFYAIFLKIWLGDNPVDPKLKRSLLGEKEEGNTRSSY